MTHPKLASNFDFAKTLTELEQITQYLERDDADLDESIKQFEQAVSRAEQLKLYLEQAELKISTLKQRFDK